MSKVRQKTPELRPHFLGIIYLTKQGGKWMPKDDRKICLCRIDGTDNKKYCYHITFDEPSPHYTVSGRPIIGYPKTPKWCPGMLIDSALSNA